AGMQDIASNDFNLNIPRYVDTFEAEAEIDIEAIAKEIHDLDAKMAQTDHTIAGFCKELGISAPF
ncbi:MAG TPA: type I restriction-modification system subunit M, partial [Saprospiraceae bacterium]|nr:type I restriction-modification system subunit M [Saprospiraceae bacterium]